MNPRIPVIGVVGAFAVVILVDAEGYTKAQTKDLEKEEAGQIYSKVAESGIEEFPGNQLSLIHI